MRQWVLALLLVLGLVAGWFIYRMHRLRSEQRLAEERAETDRVMSIAEDLQARLQKAGSSKILEKSGFSVLERLCEQFYIYEGTENLQAKVLKELAEYESFVCIGRAADYVLRDFPNVVSVFVYAPEEVCIQTEMKRLGMVRKDAEKHIQEMDKHRRLYYKHHTGKEWESPYNYDLCLNTGKLSYAQCVDMIKEYLKTKYDIVPPVKEE